MQHTIAGSEAADKEVTHFHHEISLSQCIYILFNLHLSCLFSYVALLLYLVNFRLYYKE